MSDPYRYGRSPGRRLMWIGLYLGLGLGISFLLPFPIGLLALFLTILGIDYLRARRMMKKMGINSIRDMFRRLSVPIGYRKVKYYCMSCGYEHREVSCPRCGSKMKKIGQLEKRRQNTATILKDNIRLSENDYICCLSIHINK